MTPFVWGFLLALLGAGIVIATRQGTPGAALLGFSVSLALVIGFGPGVMAPLALFVLGSGFLTRAGRATKSASGPPSGTADAAVPPTSRPSSARRRSLGVAAAAVPDLAPLFGAGASAAIAAAFADTAATETGPLAGGPVFRLRGARVSRATHGEPGGVSAAGLLAGAAAALSSRGLARAAGVGVVPGAPWTVAGAGFGAAIVESGVAGTAWGRRLGPIGRNVCSRCSQRPPAAPWRGRRAPARERRRGPGARSAAGDRNDARDRVRRGGASQLS